MDGILETIQIILLLGGVLFALGFVGYLAYLQYLKIKHRRARRRHRGRHSMRQTNGPAGEQRPSPNHGS
jgi:hypothetical protein